MPLQLLNTFQLPIKYTYDTPYLKYVILTLWVQLLLTFQRITLPNNSK